MRTFDHFPEKLVCPICNTSDDKPCVLAGVDGTSDGSNEEAKPIHVDCLMGDGWRFNQMHGIVYRFII